MVSGVWSVTTIVQPGFNPEKMTGFGTCEFYEDIGSKVCGVISGTHIAGFPKGLRIDSSHLKKGNPMRLITLVALAVVAIQAKADEPTKTSQAARELVGRYQLVSGEKDGHSIPPDRIKGSTMRIAANAMTTFDKDEKEVYVATYELDTSTRPWRITMTAKVAPDKGEGSKASGLIEKNGDTVKLIYALPGGKTPSEFKAGENQQLFVLKKVAE